MGQLSGYITLMDVSDGAPGLNNAIIYCCVFYMFICMS